ncbi:MAG: hypothetical protein L6R28_09800 [Planctomycetes bacterium]|nr:hypothetical protein [Planctomycetota bacterium]
MLSTARSPFHLHLSTCIALMFVSGGMLWLNFRGEPASGCWHETTTYPVTSGTASDGMGGWVSGGGSVSWTCGFYTAYGWPVRVRQDADGTLYYWLANLIVGVSVVALAAWLLERLFRKAPQSNAC